MFRSVLLAATLFTTPALAAPLLPTETFTLANGFKVIVHVDKSDPVAAVALATHVGSARETPGRTGFAHMFEHLFFLDSENLGTGGLDRLSARIGGSGANGNTDRDVTIYAQAVPNDALEKMIWAEADKLGFFIKTVSEPVLAKEKQVVKNEKRQSYDNRPYGQMELIMAKALYPASHPYSWPVIGSLADLDAATLGDVQDFYARWYQPANSALVVAGDVDPQQVRALAERYFAEYKSAGDFAREKPRPAGLTTTKRLQYEDNFAQLPQLGLGFPAPPIADPDSPALEVLLELLTDGRDSPLTAVLVEEMKLTEKVEAFVYDGELASDAFIQIRAFEGTPLDKVQAGLITALDRFEKNGVDATALARVKTTQEAAFYRSFQGVLQKADSIARYHAMTGRTDFIDDRLERLRAVTAADVMRVYGRVFRSGGALRPHVAVSALPKGGAVLALAGSQKAVIEEEKIVQGAEAEVDPKAGVKPYARTPSSFDRTVEPPAGPQPRVPQPAIWTAALAGGLPVSGIVDNELPLVSFQLSIDGGRLLDDVKKPGAASLLAQMLTRGTRTKTAAELENALKSLGATLEAEAGDERIIISGTTLDRNLPATAALVAEVLTQPRWDPAELALVKAATLAEIADNKAQPAQLAVAVMARVTYGPDHILGQDELGTPASVVALTMDDLKAFHARNISPASARLRVVGAVDQAAAQAAFAPLGAWTGNPVAIPEWPLAKRPEAPALWFQDLPDAKQSVLLFGSPAMRRADPDYYPVQVANYILGGGGFASRLTQQLREGKGYTYGIRSGLGGGSREGGFQIFSPVRANVTLEAAQLVREIVRDYPATFTDADLAVTKSFLVKSRARAFESQGAKLGLLAGIGDLGLPADFVAREAEVVASMTTARVSELARKWFDPQRMTYVIVGDAKTQAKRLEALGLGPVRPANGLLKE
ncbi:zinc protease [Polymorphobacter multimanifer]|uniref:Zinc protease n=1 Tax=Polymorphobacter multimanifer TaxID=1070431 RepID=A0A841L166_9SPHN|nr:pitrilysin family protein [Polymorphobacter multimanifer]MBB6226160.1 zinc protease [Polymorphobacter multimanifer]